MALEESVEVLRSRYDVFANREKNTSRFEHPVYRLAGFAQIPRMMQNRPGKDQIKLRVRERQFFRESAAYLDREAALCGQTTNCLNSDDSALIRLQCRDLESLLGQGVARNSATRPNVQRGATGLWEELLDRRPLVACVIAHSGEEKRVVVVSRLYKGLLIRLLA